MARAKGFNARLRLGWETIYGTPPGGAWAELPFASIDHGATQGLIASELLGAGRDPLSPSRDVIVVDGQAVVPVDLRNLGHWLKGTFGSPISTNKRATGSITFSANPTANSTITLSGVAWTFVAAGAAGNQTNIQGTLAATLTQLATDLNASANATIDDCKYAATATVLNLEFKVPGATGNAFTLAASTSPASNGTVSGATLDGGGWEHLFRSGGPRFRGTITFSANPANNATITLAGVVWTFVTGTPAGNQTKIWSTLAETLGQLAIDLNASADATVVRATYGSSATVLTIELDEAGPNAAAFSLAASTSPASNGTVSAAALVYIDGLPSFALEIALAESDDPTFWVTAGNKVGSLGFNFQRSGQAQLNVGLMGQGETRGAATGAGTPAVAAFDRFSQFQGAIKKGGSAIANVTGASLDYQNGLDPVPTIRADGKIEGLDEGWSQATGKIDARFADVDALLVPAEQGSAVDIELSYVRSAIEKLVLTLPAVRLPKPKAPISGPNGVQMNFDWQGEKSGAWMLQAVLRNDVATY